MDSYHLSKIAFALASIAQGAFVAMGAPVNFSLAFIWTTAGVVVLCETFWRSPWVRRARLKVSICIVLVILVEGNVAYFYMQPNITFSPAKALKIRGQGERTNILIPVHVKAKLSDATAEILSFNENL